MKASGEPVTWTSCGWVTGPIFAGEHCAPTSGSPAADVERNILVSPGSVGGSFSRSLCAVRTLALCQSLLFLALVLFICALAGAATGTKRLFDPELVRSAYATESTRDPFGSEVPGVATALGNEKTKAAVLPRLLLQGILYHPTHPAAIVNDQLVEPNRPVQLKTEQGEIEVKALQITREVVLLEVRGQTVELRLGNTGHE
jgi:hypothetical protein